MSIPCLAHRTDLDRKALVQAVAERMTFDGFDATRAARILELAELGSPRSLAYLSKVVLPPPAAALEMPVQAILRDPKPARTDGGLKGFTSRVRSIFA